MKEITNQARHRNHYFRRQFQLDSFACRPTTPCNDDRAALLIAKRFGLSVDHASTVARLAGIGGSHHEA